MCRTTTDENVIDRHQIERLTALVARQGQQLSELTALVNSQERLLNSLAGGQDGILAHRLDDLERVQRDHTQRLVMLRDSITPLYAAVERLEKQARKPQTLEPEPARPYLPTQAEWVEAFQRAAAELNDLVARMRAST